MRPLNSHLGEADGCCSGASLAGTGHGDWLQEAGRPRQCLALSAGLPRDICKVDVVQGLEFTAVCRFCPVVYWGLSSLWDWGSLQM